MMIVRWNPQSASKCFRNAAIPTDQPVPLLLDSGEDPDVVGVGDFEINDQVVQAVPRTFERSDLDDLSCVHELTHLCRGQRRCHSVAPERCSRHESGVLQVRKRLADRSGRDLEFSCDAINAEMVTRG